MARDVSEHEVVDTEAVKASVGAAAGVVMCDRTATKRPCIYVVGKGDTLSQIAERFRSSVDKIHRDNPKLPKDAHKLPSGYHLKIT